MASLVELDELPSKSLVGAVTKKHNWGHSQPCKF